MKTVWRSSDWNSRVWINMLHAKKIMIIAGEPSGELHGANLVKALRRENVIVFGVGGTAMEKEGVELIAHIRDLSVMGLTEVLSGLWKILSILSHTRKALRERKPDLLILIDFPSFNLMVAKTAMKLGIPVLYYISPKLWASRPGRAKKIKNRVSHMAVILPFEPAFYDQFDIPVTYVGNPLLDGEPAIVRANSLRKNEPPAIGLLPGSRKSEVTSLLPIMMASARKLAMENADIRFFISQAPSISREMVEAIVAPFTDVNVAIISGRVGEVFEKSDFLIAASGTVTLEAAIAGIPMVVIYRLSGITHFIFKQFIRVDQISLVNLIVGKPVVPELIQNAANPGHIADVVGSILKDDQKMNEMKQELNRVAGLLGGPGASQRVADIAFRLMEE